MLQNIFYAYIIRWRYDSNISFRVKYIFVDKLLCTKKNKIFIARFIEEILKSDDITVESEFLNFVDEWQKGIPFFRYIISFEIFILQYLF